MSNEYDPESEDNLLVSELRIIQYIDKDGALNTVDMSQAAGGAELEETAYADLINWATAFSLSAKVAAILAGE